jgi:hypothetical protein
LHSLHEMERAHLRARSTVICSCLPSAHARGELLLALGEATGGHGLPGLGLIPGLPGDVSFPGVGGFAFGEPEFGADPEVPFVVPGNVPHGEPLGESPG